MNGGAKLVVVNLVALGLFVIDRSLKMIFFPLSNEGGIVVLGSWWQLKFASNFGIAFGWPLSGLWFWIIYLPLIWGLIWWLVKSYQSKSGLEIGALTIILAGAGSNILDRFKYGFVVDYIDIKYFTVFNLADAMIFIGVAILLISIYLRKEEDHGV
ncbi:MAG: signal peptidase II [bacterium]